MTAPEVRPLLLPIGYMAKRTAPPHGFDLDVDEVCSVSNCVNEAPGGWLDRWMHNDLGLFASRADAWALVPARRDGFEVYGYRLLPEEFTGTGRQPFPLNVATWDVESLPEEFVPIGFDIASRFARNYFECSPLSCNGLALEIPVNRCCLVDGFEAAVALAQRFAREEPEPGPYCVVEVWRRRRSGAGS